MPAQDDAIKAVLTAKEISAETLLSHTIVVGNEKVEVARSHFRSLLAINPNWFGNVEEIGLAPVTKLAGNTSYEQLTALGYNPARRRLHATLDIKRSAGYSGDLCTDGSVEYVRFYVNQGAGWTDVGVVGTRVFDVPGGTDCRNRPLHPLSPSVELPYAPHRRWCTAPQLPRVRAILSWNVEPPANTPNHVPVWGNVVECNIQIAKSSLIVDWVGELTQVLEVPKELIDSLTPVLPDPPLPDPPPLGVPGIPGPFPTPDPAPNLAPLTALQLSKAYARQKVEPSRFAFAQVMQLKAAPAPPSSLMGGLAELDVDISDLVATIEDTTGNITYEELEDVGLDWHRSQLVATYRIKRQAGFSGGLCTAGSTEFVAFWADFDDTCEWTHLGTVAIKAYDFADLPDHGLCYSAVLPIDVQALLARCQDPKVARIRAVLSWNSPPSTTDPDQVPTWGNRLDAHALLPRREGQPGRMTIIAGVDASYFDDATGLVAAGAIFSDTGATVGPREVPVGGLVVVRGPALEGHRYRVRVLQGGGTSTLTESIWVDPVVGLPHLHHADADGWFDYLSYAANQSAVLGYYRSHGDDLVTIQLEVEGDGLVDTQVVQLDNTVPDIAVSITGGGTDCGDVDSGTTIQGNAVATDTWMGWWNVVIDGGPAGFGPVGTVIAADQTVSTPPGGALWTFDTTGLQQCGYVARIEASDRTIVNSTPGGHRVSTDVGFCVRS